MSHWKWWPCQILSCIYYTGVCCVLVQLFLHVVSQAWTRVSNTQWYKYWGVGTQPLTPVKYRIISDTSQFIKWCIQKCSHYSDMAEDIHKHKQKIYITQKDITEKIVRCSSWYTPVTISLDLPRWLPVSCSHMLAVKKYQIQRFTSHSIYIKISWRKNP